ncbi:MAG: nicotinate phosphoribosyltransferase [Deltaproteobacteria bacterium HGW-Deltaproteobacteria-14]|nr:MAG: nicotinate phosphoribosyltransferase [Deltaproteobacteria bacterium HGW-Deltaproteobacteria-14]
MDTLATVYRQSLALLTDLYQLTMAYGYWRNGLGNREAIFHLFFRRNPFRGGYAIAAGLEQAIDFVRGFRYADDDLTYLSGLEGADGAPLFAPAFIEHLARLELEVDIDAVPEGTAVFPHEPMLRVRGPLVQAQLLETPLLNIINFQTLIATKAARVCSAADGDPVLEFGLRRAQGIDGSLGASRAAYIGGVAATSNVLAGKLFGIPVKGTHAHSWVMVHDTELEAFAAYAEAMPNNCVFLVDTYDTLDGVRHAVEVGHRLRAAGHELLGIRLDSGDLAWLSQRAREILDAGGFPDAAIVASNDLDEHLIESLKHQGATIGVWGVGTKLVTAYDQAALGGVYKLAAIRDDAGAWEYKIKLSEQAIKVSTPGMLNIRRFEEPHGFVGDVIFDELAGLPQPCIIVDPADATRRKAITPSTPSTELLTAIVRKGNVVYTRPSLEAIRQRVQAQLSHLHAGIKRFQNPHSYPVGLEAGLFELKQHLVLEARGFITHDDKPGGAA